MAPEPTYNRAFFPNLFGRIIKKANSMHRFKSIKSIKSLRKRSKTNLQAVGESAGVAAIVTPELNGIKDYSDNQPSNTFETSKCMSLPNELFGEIFILCLPDIETCPQQLQQWFPSVDYYAVDLHTVRKSLSQVCRRWRGVVHSTPCMWTSLVLGRSLDWDAEVLKVNLERSGERLLNVYIRPKIWVESKSRVTKLMKVVQGHVHRIHSFMVDHIYWEELQGLFPLTAEPMTVMPNLHTFIIRQIGGNITLENDLIMGRVYAPKVEYMELAEAVLMNSFLTISLPHLRHLNIASPKFYVLASAYYQFLTTCPNLVSLCFSRTSCMPPLDLETEPPEHRLILPKVENLEYIQDHTPDTAFLVRSLQLPQLKSLRFGQFESPRRDPGFILELFSQIMIENAETLQHLGLLQNSIPADDTFFAPVIKTMLNLKTLVFDNVLVQDGIIKSLIPDPNDPPNMWPCPKLRTVTFDQADIEGDAVLELLKIRTIADDMMAARRLKKALAGAAIENSVQEKPVPGKALATGDEGDEGTTGKEREPVKEAEQAGATTHEDVPADEQGIKLQREETHADSSGSVATQEALQEAVQEVKDTTSTAENPVEDNKPISDNATVSSISSRTTISPSDTDDGYFQSVHMNRCNIPDENIYKSLMEFNRTHGQAVRFFY